MNYLIYGDDCRHPIVSGLLQKKGWKNRAPADLLILSPKERFLAHQTELKSNAVIWGGPATDTGLLTQRGFQKAMQSDDFRRKNSLYTAEGALALAISATSKALCDSLVLILGYGYLGRACSRLFRAAGAGVIVFSFSEKELIQARLDDYPVLQSLRFLPDNASFLLNTIPAPILDSYNRPETLPEIPLLELASIPCLSKEKNGIRVIPGGSLPSRFCPESAAYLMFLEIIRLFGKE